MKRGVLFEEGAGKPARCHQRVLELGHRQKVAVESACMVGAFSI